MNKTIKNILEKDEQRSGILTPENGESYNYTLGEPKYFTAYKATDANLRGFAKAYIKYLKRQKKLHWKWVSMSIGENPLCEIPKGFDFEHALTLPKGYDNMIDWIKRVFNLEA